MTTRPHGVAVLLLCLAMGPLTAAEPAPAAGPAQRLWEQGQQAMRDGRTDDAVRCFEQSLALDPNLVNNHLSLAAACLDKGDDEGAAPHLAQYLTAKPNHYTVRAHYAELLLRLREYPRRPPPVRALRRRRAGTRGPGPTGTGSLPQPAHGDRRAGGRRLRGPLAPRHRPVPAGRSAGTLPGGRGRHVGGGLLCKAAGELTLARRERPEEARPCWYLFAGLVATGPAAAGGPLAARGRNRRRLRLPHSGRAARPRIGGPRPRRRDAPEIAPTPRRRRGCFFWRPHRRRSR